jgi:hypothetical protein
MYNKLWSQIIFHLATRPISLSFRFTQRQFLFSIFNGVVYFFLSLFFSPSARITSGSWPNCRRNRCSCAALTPTGQSAGTTSSRWELIKKFNEILNRTSQLSALYLTLARNTESWTRKGSIQGSRKSFFEQHFTITCPPPFWTKTTIGNWKELRRRRRPMHACTYAAAGWLPDHKLSYCFQTILWIIHFEDFEHGDWPNRIAEVR